MREERGIDVGKAVKEEKIVEEEVGEFLCNGVGFGREVGETAEKGLIEVERVQERKGGEEGGGEVLWVEIRLPLLEEVYCTVQKRRTKTVRGFNSHALQRE